jgi:hypothetical protein
MDRSIYGLALLGFIGAYRTTKGFYKWASAFLIVCGAIAMAMDIFLK